MRGVIIEMEGLDRYQYKKLNHGEIRLLKFCSTPEGDLAVQILHKPFDKNTPIFAALSYTWGAQVFPHRLLVGKNFLHITTNLRDALLHVRRRIASKSDHLKKSTLLWVDAICINQSDNVEKGTQISLMSDLYIRASKVYIWLGLPENEPNVRAAALKLKHFFKQYQLAEKDVVPMKAIWLKNTLGRPDTFSLLRKFDPDDTMVFDVEGSDTHNAWLGIVEIWKKSWWNRAWVLQESTVVEKDRTIWVGIFSNWRMWAFTPHFKVIFLCGQYSTHWYEIIVSILVADYLQTMPHLNTDFLGDAQEPARKVLALKVRRMRGFVPDDSELLALLQSFRHAECFNPRDKVYSLLGLVPDPVRPHIVPNYSKSVIEVYIDSFEHTMKDQRPNLDFLGYAMKLDSPRRALSAESSHATWPSWIPNWEDPLMLQPLPKVLYSAEKAARALIMFTKPEAIMPARTALGKVYNASLDSTTDASISGLQLNVKGVRADVIIDLFSYETMSSEERQAKINEWERVIGSEYCTGETFDNALARLQVADVQYTPQGHAVARNNSVNEAILNKVDAELTGDEFRAKRAMTIAWAHTTRFRGLCLTEKGHIAVVPCSARLQDRICVLLGGQVLYVLRDVKGEHQENTFEYVGECYTHGLMDGEVMRWVEAGEATIEQFTLV